MTSSVIAAEASIEVPLTPEAAFDLYTGGINRWWRLGTMYWNDATRAAGLRFEPFVGGRFIEIQDAASGDGFEIGRVLAWEPGRRLVYTWREEGWDERCHHGGGRHVPADRDRHARRAPAHRLGVRG